MTNQTRRILELLRRFNDNQTVCIETLKNDPLWEGKSEKTIRRDLEVIKNVFPDTFHLIRGGEPGCYKAITRQAFENFMKPEVLSLMAQAFIIAEQNRIFENFEIDNADRRIIDEKIGEWKEIYAFKSRPLEYRSTSSIIFRQLEHAIKHHKKIVLEYNIGRTTQFFKAKPYKILFMNENFYLAAEVEEKEYRFTNFRINKIKKVKSSGVTFHRNSDISDFIEFIQTPFAKYKEPFRKHLVTVTVRIDPAKAHFFKVKNFLSSQRIVEENEDGSLILQYTVTQEREVEDLIMRWLPHMQVIKPLSLKKHIIETIACYIHS